MLCTNNYGHEYIDHCRAQIDAQVAAYQKLAAATADQPEGPQRDKLAKALDTVEWMYFNNMVLELENYFVHRTRGLEKKDGNPLNEVRVLSNSLMGNNGKLTVEKQIKLNPETSVLGYREGDEIKVTEKDFVRLAKAFLADIELKFL